MIKVIALDPGRTTGYATGEISAGKMKVSSHQETFKHSGLFTKLHLLSPGIIVCEDFEYRRPTKANPGFHPDLFPRELIGVVELYCQINHKKLYLQKASQGKGYYTDAILKSENLHRRGNPHANDACRHLLHWYTFGAGYQYNKEGFEPQ